MNTAERRRGERIAAMSDIDLLNYLVGDDELDPDERTRFVDMLASMTEGQPRLTKKQRQFAVEVAERITPIDARDVPRGDPVVTPEVLLRPLPLKPPGKVLR